MYSERKTYYSTEAYNAAVWFVMNNIYCVLNGLDALSMTCMSKVAFRIHLGVGVPRIHVVATIESLTLRSRKP